MTQKDKRIKALELLNKQFHFEETFPKTDREVNQMKMLSDYLNDLIEHDFNKLLSILYRIDVSEAKVRTALADNPTQQSAGKILATLLIEREVQKIEMREKYSQ